MSKVATLKTAEKMLGEVDTSLRRFRPYDQYTATNNPNIREIPNGWKLRRLKFFLSEPLNYGANEAAELDDPSLPRYIRITDIDERGKLRPETFRSIIEKQARPYLLQEGDLLLARSGATVGKTFFYQKSWGRAAFAGYLIRARIGPTSDPRFVNYFMNSHDYWQWLNSVFIQSTIQNVSAEKYANLPVTLPPLDEQRAIAAFLDRETAKIDSLVAKKRRLIELLAEKRTALILHAVTKGLNPDAPMKSSDIDWLGDVPKHWEFRKLGFLVSLRGGMTPSKGTDSYWKGSIPWVSPKDMKSREILDSEDHISESALSETTLALFPPPVVLMVVRGMILAHTFPVAITKVPVTVNQDMKVLTPKKGCTEEYLLNLLNGLSRVILGTVDDSAHGTKVMRLPVWKHVGIYLPGESEQAEICNHINEIMIKFNGLIKKVELAIDRLNEYRSALISAAVTGQIDVRGEVM